MTRLGELKEALDAEHDSFLSALESVDLELVTVLGIVEDWSVRDLVVHVAFWAEHAAEALALASAGRGDEFAYDTAQTDAMNARVLEESRRTDPAEAVEREMFAYEAFAAALDGLDPSLLDQRLGNGDTVADVIGYDGAAHYREHTAHMRAWFDEDPDDDAADADGVGE